METRAREQKPTGIVTPLSPRISSFFISSEIFTSWKRFPTFILRELPSPCTPVSSAAASASAWSVPLWAHAAGPSAPGSSFGVEGEKAECLPLNRGAFQKGLRSREGQKDPSPQPRLPPTHSLREAAVRSAALTSHPRHVTSRLGVGAAFQTSHTRACGSESSQPGAGKWPSWGVPSKLCPTALLF